MLTHYIFVRKDLPLGVMAAMVAHAAGHSIDRTPLDIGTTVVVLEARDEWDLKIIHDYLDYHKIYHYPFEETEGIYAGQQMSIGIFPMGSADPMREKLKGFKLLRELDKPTGGV